QFVNILDFMMIMPLGPDFTTELQIPAALLGLLGSAYAVSASVAGLAGAWVLDRFDRKTALLWSLLGLVLGTAAGGFAIGFKSMMAARLLAGLFGGPATSLAISALTDLVPIERRGRAIGAIMGAFSVASVAGVPLGLWLARHGGFRTPFFVVAGLGLLILAFTFVVLPPLRSHLQQLVPARSLTEILRRPVVRLALTTIAVSNMATFAIVPSMAPYLIRNCGMRRTDLEYMYALGGACTFVSMRIVGWLVDRYGAARVMVLASLFLSGVLVTGFLPEHNLLPITIVFVGFLISVSSRNVCVNATCSRVAAPSERARYQSLQSAVQHMASAVGAALGPIFLHELADGRLGGIAPLSVLSIVLALALPTLMYRIYRLGELH
ncbi:MAG TPA: MFS transporter, partial [Pseudomonadota bacterium]|nr:MFS transporter [Pseudomonadota bacterium]